MLINNRLKPQVFCYAEVKEEDCRVSSTEINMETSISHKTFRKSKGSDLISPVKRIKVNGEIHGVIKAIREMANGEVNKEVKMEASGEDKEVSKVEDNGVAVSKEIKETVNGADRMVNKEVSKVATNGEDREARAKSSGQRNHRHQQQPQ